MIIKSIVRITSELISKGYNIIIYAIIARILGQSVLGEYNYFLALASIFMVFIDFGLNIIILRDLTNKEGDKQTLLGNALILKGTVTVVLLAFLEILDLLIRSINISSTFWLIILLQVAMSFFQLFSSIYRATNRLEIESVFVLVNRTLTFVFSILVLIFLESLNSFLILSICILLGNLIFSYQYIKNNIVKPNYKFSKFVIKYIIQESYVALIGAFLTAIYFRTDTIILGIMDTDRIVGIYSAAYKIFDSLIIVPTFLVMAYIPNLSIILKNKKNEDNELSNFISILIICSSFIIIFLILFSKEIIFTLFGDGFKNSILILDILTISLFFVFLNNLGIQIFVLKKKQWYLTKINFIACLFNIGLNIFLIKYFKGLGAAFSTGLTEVILLVFIFIPIARRVKVKINLKVAISLFAFVIISFILSKYYLLIKILFFLFFILFLLTFLRSHLKKIINWGMHQ